MDKRCIIEGLSSIRGYVHNSPVCIDYGYIYIYLKKYNKITYSYLHSLTGARQAMETVFIQYPDSVTHEHINLLLEVLLAMGDYSHGVLVLMTYAEGVRLLHEVTTLLYNYIQ